MEQINFEITIVQVPKVFHSNKIQIKLNEFWIWILQTQINHLAQLPVINMALRWHKMFTCNLILMCIMETFLHNCIVFWILVNVSGLIKWKCIWTILFICCPWLISENYVISMPCWKWELKALCCSFTSKKTKKLANFKGLYNVCSLKTNHIKKIVSQLK
jgi:hypothetical protein